ncbi:MAG: hypothetical protein ACU83O_10770, partial [Gammaproteobacteria bacterium]
MNDKIRLKGRDCQSSTVGYLKVNPTTIKKIYRDNEMQSSRTSFIEFVPFPSIVKISVFRIRILINRRPNTDQVSIEKISALP